ncbi:hypothetical protein, partial [Yersinia pestis]
TAETILCGFLPWLQTKGNTAFVEDKSGNKLSVMPFTRLTYSVRCVNIYVGSFGFESIAVSTNN